MLARRKGEVVNSIKHSAGFSIDQPIDQVFPLFSPEGEKRWVPDWDYENVMGTTELSEDYVFLTRAHDHAVSDAIWLIKQYLPDDWLIQFYRVEPEEKIGVVTVQCSKTNECMTHVEVTYRYIALSDEGRNFIDSFTIESYEKFIDEWRVLLLQYFEN
ncbi:MAG: hypothetical protein IMF03_09565 [Proteobacteria bacterium]|nr:hypothetical protein [Pseudomonadota bacterium]